MCSLKKKLLLLNYAERPTQEKDDMKRWSRSRKNYHKRKIKFTSLIKGNGEEEVL